MIPQQKVEVNTSLLSFGANNLLYGLKCEPSLPGLLFHWNVVHIKNKK
jgi:hypothetical protein